MADIQTINIGASPNDGEGDALRIAFEKTNINFSLLNSELANLAVNVTGAENVGASGVGILKGRNSEDPTVLEFKKLISGSGITITDIGDEISITSSLAIDIAGQAPGSVLTISGQGGLNVTGLLKVDLATDSIVMDTSLNMNLSPIRNLANPTNSQDAATKFYVDAQLTAASTGVSVLENNNLITSARQLNFVGNGVNIVQSAVGKVDISITGGVDTEAVQSIVGQMFTDNLSEGIVTTYSPSVQKINFAVDDFDIVLQGDVAGSASVTAFGSNIVIDTTVADFIKGIAVEKNSFEIGPANSIKTLNFVGDNISVARNGNVANIQVTSSVTGDQITDLLNPRMLGQQDGLSITYDSLNRIYNYRVNPITIRLAGAVSGSGVITFDGTAVDGNVVINTTGGTDGGGGISVADEGDVQGQASVINFVGGGITTAVSLDGTTATVYVPNSPAAEPFITAVAGSENVPNARRLVAGTGVAIVDGGPGGNIVISANSDAILAKSSYGIDGAVVAEQFGINFKSTQWIIPIMEDDSGNNRVNLSVYDLRDAWFRLESYDAGTLEDNEGPILDFGPIVGGILEAKPNLGLIS